MAKIKQTYEVAQDGFLLGDFYKAGTTVDLYPEQARYDLPPHGTMLKPLAAMPATAPARRAAPSASDAKRGAATTSAPEGAN